MDVMHTSPEGGTSRGVRNKWFDNGLFTSSLTIVFFSRQWQDRLLAIVWMQNGEEMTGTPCI